MPEKLEVHSKIHDPSPFIKLSSKTAMNGTYICALSGACKQLQKPGSIRDPGAGAGAAGSGELVWVLKMNAARTASAPNHFQLHLLSSP